MSYSSVPSMEGHEDMRSGPGPRLREERNRIGLTQEEIASRLNLETNVIDALERDAYEKLGAPIFVIGYLRNYSRILDLDEQPIIAAYKSLGHELPPVLSDLTQRQPMKKPAEKPAYLKFLVIGAVVVVVLGLLAFLFTGGDEPSQQVESEPLVPLTPTPGSRLDDGGENALALPALSTPSTTPAPSSPAAAQIPLPVAPPVPETVDVSSGDSDSAIAIPPPQSERPDSTPATPAPDEVVAAGEMKALKLTFREESWVEVTDARDKRIFFRLGQPGQAIEREGVPPFKLLLGAAAAVDVEYDGEPYDHSSHHRKGVARFTLGNEE